MIFPLHLDDLDTNLTLPMGRVRHSEEVEHKENSEEEIDEQFLPLA
jgi:hypothetical protein